MTKIINLDDYRNTPELTGKPDDITSELNEIFSILQNNNSNKIWELCKQHGVKDRRELINDIVGLCKDELKEVDDPDTEAIIRDKKAQIARLNIQSVS